MSKELNTAIPMEDSNGAEAPVTISMSQFVDGISTVFAGVVQMLEALEPESSGRLSIAVAKRYPQDTEHDVPAKGQQDSPTVTPSVPTAETAQQPGGRKAAEDVKKQDKGPGVTVEDITKIIVQKIKKDPANNGKIRELLKAYGFAKVSELPVSKYEAFLTDISQL